MSVGEQKGDLIISWAWAMTCNECKMVWFFSCLFFSWTGVPKLAQVAQLFCDTLFRQASCRVNLSSWSGTRSQMHPPLFPNLATHSVVSSSFTLSSSTMDGSSIHLQSSIINHVMSQRQTHFEPAQETILWYLAPGVKGPSWLGWTLRQQLYCYQGLPICRSQRSGEGTIKESDQRPQVVSPSTLCSLYWPTLSPSLSELMLNLLEVSLACGVPDLLHRIPEEYTLSFIFGPTLSITSGELVVFFSPFQDRTWVSPRTYLLHVYFLHSSSWTEHAFNTIVPIHSRFLVILHRHCHHDTHSHPHFIFINHCCYGQWILSLLAPPSLSPVVQ